MTKRRRETGDRRSLGLLIGIGILILIVLAAWIPAGAAADTQRQAPLDKAVGTPALGAPGQDQGTAPPGQETKLPKEKRITPQDRQEAAKKMKGAYEQALVTQAAQATALDPGGVPHYFGPYPNYANSPMPKGPILSVTVDNGGTGYTAPTVLIVDVYGTNTSEATATATVVGGVITDISIVAPGANYTAPRVIITDPAGTGALATAHLDPAQLSGGIHKFTSDLPSLQTAVPDTTSFPAGGRGYTSPPTIQIVDVNGTGANATPVMSGDTVASVTIVSGGSGYSPNPVVTFTGGGVNPTQGVGAHALGKATVVNGAITAITLIGCDYYEIELGQFTQKLHPDLPPTTLRGYRQTNMGGTAFSSLGPTIVAQRDRPVRVRFTNSLPTEAGGDLFIPVDTTVMGAGHGDQGGSELYPQNRAAIHLHGGTTPWISDGTPFQWTTPAGEATSYPHGVSVYNVPDMADWGPNPKQGVLTFFYTNQQSARLLFYHDHAHGITRLNVYAGEAGAYLVTDPVEQDLIDGSTNTGVNPTDLPVLPAAQIPLVIQDKSFVDATTIGFQDPTWAWGTGGPGNPVTGDLWYPHVYVPAQDPSAPNGVNPFGRWAYGPWFWPPTNVPFGPVTNPYYDGVNPLEPAEIPGVPNPSMAMEAFMDTAMVNGEAYPVLTVDPKAYRLRILNAADDRFFNLQFYKGNVSDYLAGGFPTEVSMVPAVPNPSFPPDWPTDGRDGGAPDPTTVGPKWIQIGTEGGFLPAPVEIPNQPITWVTDPTVFNAGNVDKHSLLIAPGERSDVIVDFSQFAGQTLILYNDAPAAFPARDPRYDYYTNHTDLTDTGGAPTTQPGYGPNTRTLVQIRVAATTPAPAYDLAALQSVFASTPSKPGVFEVSQDPIISTSAAYNSAYNVSATRTGGTFPVDNAVRIFDKSYTFDTVSGTTVTIPITSKAIQDEQGEAFDEYGRLSGFLGLQVEQVPGQQTLLLYGYESPPIDILTDATGTKIGEAGDGTQIWKITHNGVDTHPIHWHMVNIQVINRVGWDGIIRQPDANELGWKETLRVSPLEDTIIAVRAVAPWLPWDTPNSHRPIDPTEPLGATLTGSPGAAPQFFDVSAEPVTVINKVVNYGWEYVWHCHILGHEEMDMMHALLFATPPKKPSNLTLADLGGNKGVQLRWKDNSAGETGFVIQRASDPGFTTGLVTFAAGPDVTTYTDATIAKKATNYYRVFAINLVGDPTTYPAPAVGFPTKKLNSGYSNTAIWPIGATAPTVTPAPPLAPPAAPGNVAASTVRQGGKGARINLGWTDLSNNEAGFRIDYALNSAFTSGLVSTTVGPNVTTFTSGNVLRQTDYFVRIQSFNTAGVSTWVTASPFPVRTP